MSYIASFTSRDHSFSTYEKFSGKLTFLPLWYAPMCAYQGVRNVNFSENFAYVLNEWRPMRITYSCENDFTACMWIEKGSIENAGYQLGYPYGTYLDTPKNQL